jgi:hypothetical protein
MAGASMSVAPGVSGLPCCVERAGVLVGSDGAPWVFLSGVIRFGAGATGVCFAFGSATVCASSVLLSVRLTSPMALTLALAVSVPKVVTVPWTITVTS